MAPEKHNSTNSLYRRTLCSFPDVGSNPSPAWFPTLSTEKVPSCQIGTITLPTSQGCTHDQVQDQVRTRQPRNLETVNVKGAIKIQH